jgi:DNA-binding IclR family transcriptional regulator
MSRAPMAARSARLLKFLARDPTRWYSLSELARMLGIGKATLHGLLVTLVDEGFLLRDPRDKRYALGPALVAIGEAAASHRLFGLARMASDEIRKLAAAFDAQCTTSCVVADAMVILDAAGGPDRFGRVTQIGEQVPLVPPMGSVFMAWASDAEVTAWVARATAGTPRRGGTLRAPARARAEQGERTRDPSSAAHRRSVGAARGTDEHVGIEARPMAPSSLAASYLRELLDAVRRRGFAVSMRHQVLADPTRTTASPELLAVPYDTDLVSAPVFDAEGGVVLAISLFGFPAPLDEQRAIEAGQAVREAADAVTRRIGGTVPSSAYPGRPRPSGFLARAKQAAP